MDGHAPVYASQRVTTLIRLWRSRAFPLIHPEYPVLTDIRSGAIYPMEMCSFVN